MNIKVIYNSKTGNTRKVAEAIAQAVGTSAEPISANSKFDSIDLLFLGSGVYWWKIDNKTKDFIKTLNGRVVKNVAVFGTFGHYEKALISMKKLLEKQGINVINKSFGSRGGLAVLGSKHPGDQDLENAKEFAYDVIKEIEKL